MRIFKAIRCNGVSFNVRYDNDETQSLIRPQVRSSENRFNQYFAAIVGMNYEV